MYTDEVHQLLVALAKNQTKMSAARPNARGPLSARHDALRRRLLEIPTSVLFNSLAKEARTRATAGDDDAVQRLLPWAVCVAVDAHARQSARGKELMRTLLHSHDEIVADNAAMCARDMGWQRALRRELDALQARRFKLAVARARETSPPRDLDVQAIADGPLAPSHVALLRRVLEREKDPILRFWATYGLLRAGEAADVEVLGAIVRTRGYRAGHAHGRLAEMLTGRRTANPNPTELLRAWRADPPRAHRRVLAWLRRRAPVEASTTRGPARGAW